MFIRQTKTGSSTTPGESYFTYRLVSSERIGKRVRQHTLLNLGRQFTLPREKWASLCTRIEQLLGGQLTFLPAPAEIEEPAQRYAARLITKRAPVGDVAEKSEAVYQEVDVNSLELVRPRSVGVEHIGLSALSWLGLSEILESMGLNGIQRAVAVGGVIARMAAPGSELSTRHRLREKSALGELLDVDFEGLPLMRLYRVSDLLVRHRDDIEKALFARINDLFSLPTTITLYDLTNTCFEGEMSGNARAAHGHSKEKRSDCPLVTLGLVLDGSGFVRRSRMFEGNVSEPVTLEGMLCGLDAPREAMVIMDRGIATEANIAWLVEHSYRYLVVSREQNRRFDESCAVGISGSSEGHLFITVLAYQAVQVLRRQLKAQKINLSWSRLREIFSVQQRVAATFKQRDGRTLHVRKATIAESSLKELYEALALPASPGGIQKLTI